MLTHLAALLPEHHTHATCYTPITATCTHKPVSPDNLILSRLHQPAAPSYQVLIPQHAVVSHSLTLSLTALYMRAFKNPFLGVTTSAATLLVVCCMSATGHRHAPRSALRRDINPIIDKPPRRCTCDMHRGLCSVICHVLCVLPAVRDALQF